MGVGAVEGLSCAAVEVDGEGENQTQREGLQALTGVGVEQWSRAEGHIGHRHHLRNEPTGPVTG